MVPKFSNISQKNDEKIPIGFKVSKEQYDDLRKWADFFYKQQSIDEGGKPARIIDKPDVGLLVKEATYTFIYQYKFFLQMKNNPQMMNFIEQFQSQLQQQQQQQQ